MVLGRHPLALAEPVMVATRAKNLVLSLHRHLVYSTGANRSSSIIPCVLHLLPTTGQLLILVRIIHVDIISLFVVNRIGGVIIEVEPPASIHTPDHVGRC